VSAHPQARRLLQSRIDPAKKGGAVIMKTTRPSDDSRHDEEPEPREQEQDEERPRPLRVPRRPGLVIGPTTDDSDVQLEW